MTPNMLLKLSVEVGDALDKITAARESLFYLTQSMSEKNPEMSIFYYLKYEEAQKRYEQSCKLLKSQINRLVIENRHSSLDKDRNEIKV